MSKTHVITKLRAYKPDGTCLEFIVGDSYTGAGVISSIEQNGDTFSVYFNNNNYTFISGFPYTTLRELK